MQRERLCRAAEAAEKMEAVLKSGVWKQNEVKAWDRQYIFHQINKREAGGEFTVKDHIQAMVYAMLSGEKLWGIIEKHIDSGTGCIADIDKIFSQYDPDKLLRCDSEKLTKEIRTIKCGNRRLKQQIEALKVNIEKLLNFEKQYGSIDKCYEGYMERDANGKALVKKLSAYDSDMKMRELGEALAAEYLRNAGYDIAKPDRHLRRILGSGGLGCSQKEHAPTFEVFDIVAEIAAKLGKRTAEVDYILWSYCANGCKSVV